MPQLTFIPVGGMANRMRAIVSAYSLSKDINSDLKIIWFRDWAMRCRFHELFEPLPENIILKEADKPDLLLNDRPRKKNFYLPLLFEKVRYDICLYEEQVREMHLKQIPFTEKVRNKNVYIASFSDFYPWNDDIYSLLFIPVRDIREEINRRIQFFNSRTIGIHIRRTDNTGAISNSPTYLFIEKMEKEIKDCPEILFYLATDSETDRQIIQDKFGERIITFPQEISRRSLKGMKNAVADLYTLSHTSRIYGCYNSSFSPVASRIKKKECIIIDKNHAY
ncbi:MAG: glycosyl transferase [Candidatus Azobacteroides sp.]|nr:glycosyl transferase [Candidatus Azobacteroides sp.]